MRIKRAGSQPTGETPTGCFAGTVRAGPGAAGTPVTFEPGALPLGQTLAAGPARGASA
ncbi:hypothetical protein [Muricoccus pecuniae]|uniref:Uncharacterized protein n=1 Tax=Muricoccus pecuniae TaxID=693023 RepID=A0A840Y4A5_9PROT|nr:hypothetical protein [Roseomonas pecuniae]MBB5694996.1 hypothetical protein [Roseomonas pecuniae]